jgi:hypothetical protein
MTGTHTDDLVDFLDAAAPTATIVAQLTSLEAATALMVPPGWSALLARLLIALDREATRRRRRVSIELVREKFGTLCAFAGVVDGVRVDGAAWVGRILVRFAEESEKRCVICGRLTPPPDAFRRWRSPRCTRHDKPGWAPPVDPPDLSAHARLRALVALDARGPWRLARTYDGEVWRLPVRRGRHDALVSVRADEAGAFVSAALTQSRDGPVRLGAARLLSAEARLEAAAAAALGLPTAPTA